MFTYLSEFATGLYLKCISTFTKIKAHYKFISANFYHNFCIFKFFFVLKTSIKQDLFANNFILLVNKLCFTFVFVLKTSIKQDLFANNFILLVNKLCFTFVFALKTNVKSAFKHIFGSHYTYYNQLPTKHIANLKGCYQYADWFS